MDCLQLENTGNISQFTLALVLTSIYPIIWVWLPKIYARWPRLRENESSRVLAVAIAATVWNVPLIGLFFVQCIVSVWTILLWVSFAWLWWQRWSAYLQSIDE